MSSTERPAKRQKVSSSTIVESRNLPDISSEIISVHVGKKPRRQATCSSVTSGTTIAETKADDSATIADTDTALVAETDEITNGKEDRDCKIAEVKQEHQDASVITDDDVMEVQDGPCNGEGADLAMEAAAASDESDDDSNDNDSDNDGDGEDDEKPKEFEVFHVHKSLLCQSSLFLQNAAKRTGAGPQTIYLPDELPSCFRVYLKWLYFGKIAVEVDVYITDDEDEVMVQLIQSYILGEKLRDEPYQNAIISALILFADKADKYPNDEAVQLAYKGTRKSSPLRRLLVDYWLWLAKESWLPDDNQVVQDICAEFANDLIAALVKQRPCLLDDENSAPWVKRPKAYLLNSKDVTQNGRDA
ncbi:hypothetical protein ACN47E_009643 [Coniothyrium glycines]